LPAPALARADGHAPIDLANELQLSPSRNHPSPRPLEDQGLSGRASAVADARVSYAILTDGRAVEAQRCALPVHVEGIGAPALVGRINPDELEVLTEAARRGQ
jgi:DNA-binding MarR family transcriptional regulator